MVDRLQCFWILVLDVIFRDARYSVERQLFEAFLIQSFVQRNDGSTIFGNMATCLSIGLLTGRTPFGLYFSFLPIFDILNFEECRTQDV